MTKKDCDKTKTFGDLIRNHPEQLMNSIKKAREKSKQEKIKCEKRLHPRAHNNRTRSLQHNLNGFVGSLQTPLHLFTNTFQAQDTNS